MARRKQLKGIALALLGTFVSRNNDIYGYWGLGVLKLCAMKNGLSKIIIDLLEQSPGFDANSPIHIAEKTYQSWLFRTLEKARFDKKQLERAEIHLEFSTFDEFPKAIRDTRGEPYQCSVILKSKGGTSYLISKIGVCAEHDPAKDRQSTRVV